MKKCKSNLDEMQEQKMLKIEHNACWLGFFGLVAVIYLQIAIGNGGIEAIGGEAAVVLLMGICIMVGCVRNGIWDRNLKPNVKTNLIASLVAGLVFGGFWGIVSYVRYHALAGSVAAFAFCFGLVAVLVFVLLSGLSAIYKRRAKRMEEKTDEEEME